MPDHLMKYVHKHKNMFSSVIDFSEMCLHIGSSSNAKPQRRQIVHLMLLLLLLSLSSSSLLLSLLLTENYDSVIHNTNCNVRLKTFLKIKEKGNNGR